MKSQVIQGNNIEILREYPDNYFDSIVTDPPYGIEFLGKDWDSNTGAVETWSECLRVLKPGGYLLAFSAARTYHQLATNIEGVGFEIRDQLMWLYASGFPKAQDVGKMIDKRNGVNHDYIDYHTDSKDSRVVSNNGNAKNRHCKECGKQLGTSNIQCNIKDCKVINPPIQSEWAGWKTALKPAHEPIVMARKPFKGSTIDNVLEHGVGALNIDATRIPAEKDLIDWYNKYPEQKSKDGVYENYNPEVSIKKENTQPIDNTEIQGRFPSNVIGEVEGYQKYFYCPKVSRAERHTGFEQTDIPTNPDGFLGTDGEWATEHWHGKKGQKQKGNLDHIPTTKGGMWDVDGTGVQYNAHKVLTAGNNHPTVKPVALMRYLITLVTPPGGKVLDPFTGSGSTGMAAVELGYDFTGCELDPNYVDIANTRISAWYHKTNLDGEPLPKEWFDES